MVDYTNSGTPNIPSWLSGLMTQRPRYGSQAPVTGVLPSSTNAASNPQGNQANPFGFPTGGNSNGGGNSQNGAPLTINSNGVSFTDPNNPLKQLLGPIGSALGGLFNMSGQGASGQPSSPLNIAPSQPIPGAVGPTSVGGAPLVPPAPSMSPQTAATMAGRAALPQGPAGFPSYYGTPQLSPQVQQGLASYQGMMGPQAPAPQAPQPQAPQAQAAQPYGPTAPPMQAQNGLGPAGIMSLLTSNPTSGPQVPQPQTPSWTDNPLLQALMGGGA